MPTKREEALPLRYHFHDKPSDAAVAPLYTHLTSLRFLAISAPLKAGLRFTLALRIPLQNSYPAARQVPSIVAADCPNANGVVLRLNTALQRDLDRLSQVWTAEVVGVPGTSLVMKIIQPSLCPLPDPSNSKWREAYYDPLDLAHNEAWVYQMLAHRQGLSIPYFFGLFDIITPSGEAAWALVLEFVPGPTVHDIVTFTSTADVHDFCSLGLDTVRDLALSGWTLRDIRCSNFILCGRPGPQTVVMIDLYATKHITPPPSPERLAIVDAMRFYYMFARCVGDKYPDIHDWAAKNLPRGVWDYDYDHGFSESEDDSPSR